jgi:hypothetical protein
MLWVSCGLMKIRTQDALGNDRMLDFTEKVKGLAVVKVGICKD